MWQYRKNTDSDYTEEKRNNSRRDWFPNGVLSFLGVKPLFPSVTASFTENKKTVISEGSFSLATPCRQSAAASPLSRDKKANMKLWEFWLHLLE
jgi:hypothetical protein